LEHNRWDFGYTSWVNTDQPAISAS